MPVAQRLLATTDSAFQRVVSDGWLAGLFRMHVVPTVAAIAMSSRRVRKAAFRTLSQTGIRYPDSPLSRTIGAPNDGPRAGERFPWLTLTFAPGGRPEDLFKRLDDRHFNLIVIGQPAPTAASFGAQRSAARACGSARRKQRSRAVGGLDRRAGVLPAAAGRPHRPRRQRLRCRCREALAARQPRSRRAPRAAAASEAGECGELTRPQMHADWVAADGADVRLGSCRTTA